MLLIISVKPILSPLQLSITIDAITDLNGVTIAIIPQLLPTNFVATSGLVVFLIILGLLLARLTINLLEKNKKKVVKDRGEIDAAEGKAKLTQTNTAPETTYTLKHLPPLIRPITLIEPRLSSPQPALVMPPALPIRPVLLSPTPLTLITETLSQKLLPAVVTKKPDWSAFQQLLQQHSIARLYHFTDRENLASIRAAGGLLSWYSCKQNAVAIARPGGSETSWQLDANKGLADYVRLAFIPDHPMLYVAKRDGRIKSPVILEIDSEVIFLQQTKFSLMNAAKNGVSATGDLEKFSSLKFHVFRQRYFNLPEEDKPYYQAEVLIHRMVPIKYILNLNRLPV